MVLAVRAQARAAPVATAAARSRRRAVSVAARKTAAKGQAQAYVCIDCGWIYDGSNGPFEKLPGSYRCPVCNSPKRRFTEAKGKAKSSTKGASMRRGEGDGKFEEGDKSFLAAAAVGGAALLGALYFFLSSQVS